MYLSVDRRSIIYPLPSRLGPLADNTVTFRCDTHTHVYTTMLNAPHYGYVEDEAATRVKYQYYLANDTIGVFATI